MVKFLPLAKVKLLRSEVASRLAVKFLFMTKVAEGFEVKGMTLLSSIFYFFHNVYQR